MANKKVFTIELDGVKQAVTNVQALRDELVQMEKALDLIEKDTDAYARAQEKLIKAQRAAAPVIAANARSVNDLKAAQELLSKAFESSQFGTAEYAALSKQLQDVNSRLKVIDESTSDITSAEKVEGFVRFGSAIGGAFATGAAAAQAFGASGEEIEKVQQKFAVLVATLQTLQLVQEATGRENKLFTSIVNRFGSEADGSFRKAGLASKLFGNTTRAAIAATGIGLLVLALAAIITNFDKIKGKALEFARSFKPVNDAIVFFEEKVGGFPQLFSGLLDAASAVFLQIGKLGTGVGKVIASLFTGDSTKAAFDQLLADASAFGGKVGEAFARGVSEKNAEISLQAANKLLETQIAANGRLLKVQQAYGNESFALRKKILSDEITLIEGQQKLLDKASDEFAEKETERLDKIADLRVLSIEATNARIAAQFEALKKRLESAGEKLSLRIGVDGFEFKPDSETENQRIVRQNSEGFSKRLNAAMAAIKIKQVDIPLVPKVDAAPFLAKLNAEILGFTGSAKFQAFADEAARAGTEALNAITGIASGLTGLFAAQLAGVQAQVESVREQVAETDRQITDSLVKQNEAEEQLKNATGRRREFLILQIEREQKKEKTLNDQKKQQAAEQAKLEKEAAKRKENLAKAEKAIQIGQAISNTALAVIKFLANPGGLAGVGLSIGAGILGALQVATISAQKFALGGILQGKPHSQGGVPITVGGRGGYEGEGGEAIINRRSTERFKNELSAMNAYNGWGVRFAQGGITPQAAPVSAPSMQQAGGTGNEMLLEELRMLRAETARINSAPVKIAVSEITDTQARVAQVRELAALG